MCGTVEIAEAEPFDAGITIEVSPEEIPDIAPVGVVIGDNQDDGRSDQGTSASLWPPDVVQPLPKSFARNGHYISPKLLYWRDDIMFGKFKWDKSALDVDAFRYASSAEWYSTVKREKL